MHLILVLKRSFFSGDSNVVDGFVINHSELGEMPG